MTFEDELMSKDADEVRKVGVNTEVGQWLDGHSYVTFWGCDEVTLDGDFTKRELEIIARHMEDITQEDFDKHNDIL